MVDRVANKETTAMSGAIPSETTARIWRGLLGAGIAIALAFGVASLAPGNADAFTITNFSATPSTAQAGGHPDVTVKFQLENHLEPGKLEACACNDVRNIIAHLPTGLIGNPHAYPQCTAAQFANSECPVDSQIGTATPDANVGFFIAITIPLYNLVPQPDQAGLVGFTIPLFGAPVYTVLSARTDSDYGLDTRTEEISHLLPIRSFVQEIWGVPADPSHDALRFSNYKTGFPEGAPTPSNSPLRPFLQNPTTCGIPLTAVLEAEAYNGETTSVESPWPGTTGCSQLSFNPSLAAKPTTTEADSPSGLDVELTVPQTQSPTTPSPSEIRTTTVSLPEGFTINPNAADGKVACLDADANIGTLNAANCPEYAKIGSLTIESAVLPGDLPGAVYLADPLPGNRYRIFLVADGFGIHVKLPGTVTPNPETGALDVSVPDIPQFPLETFRMHLFGAERGVLATPKHCGTYAVKSKFVPWNTALSSQTSTQFFTIDSGPGGSPCPSKPRPFEPTFDAASTGNTAGAHAPFWVEMERGDGSQVLDGLTVTTPPGFSGTLKGIPYCSEVALAQLDDPLYPGMVEQQVPSCSPASQIGSAVTGAGAGSKPLYTGGKVYLAGPYKGAPSSLVVVIPAVSGPYDVGNVAVRAAIKVDPTTAQVTTVSDPFPRILEGIPLRTRSIRVTLDRPDFALNPTNCSQFAVAASISGDEGTTVSRSKAYQVANCATLPFEPTLNMRFSGGVNRRGHPAIHAVLSAAGGEANLDEVSVTLPHGELLDNAHINTICTRVQFAADSCPAGSIIGKAEAVTPLLDQPLKGSVYLRSNLTHKLPDLVLDFKGQVDFEAAARIDAVKGRLRTTFENTPDVPISSVVVDLAGGAKGLVQNSESLCGTTKTAMATITGQNGKTTSRRPKLQVKGCAAAKKRQKRHKRHTEHRKAVR